VEQSVTIAGTAHLAGGAKTISALIPQQHKKAKAAVARAPPGVADVGGVAVVALRPRARIVALRQTAVGLGVADIPPLAQGSLPHPGYS